MVSVLNHTHNIIKSSWTYFSDEVTFKLTSFIGFNELSKLC